jgi:integrase
MLLVDFVERYARENDLADGSVEQLRIPARLLDRFAGGALPCQALCDDLVNEFLISRQRVGRSPETVASNRTKLLTLWRSAADAGLCAPPGRIRRIKRPQRIVRAFTHEAISRLLCVVRTLRGNIHYRDRLTSKWRDTGVRRRDYFRAFILADYDSGMRRGDLLSIERNWIRQDGRGGGAIALVQSKTGRVQTKRFRARTMRAIDRLCNGRTTGRIWIGYDTKRAWCQEFKRIVRKAGVGGSSKWLRRSSASYIARRYGKEAAKRHLGHASDGVADASYLDPLIAFAPVPLPPPIS